MSVLIARETHHTGPALGWRALWALLGLLLLLGAGSAWPAAAQVDVAGLLAQPVVRRPPLLPAADVAARAAALHESAGGATVSPYWGDLAGQRLFVVDLFPERERIVTERTIPSALIEAFIADNQDLFADPRNTVGTYYEPTIGASYLNVSSVLPDRARALALAQRHDQQFVFDLAATASIPLGGSGVAPPDLPPLDQRLPPLQVE